MSRLAGPVAFERAEDHRPGPRARCPEDVLPHWGPRQCRATVGQPVMIGRSVSISLTMKSKNAATRGVWRNSAVVKMRRMRVSSATCSITRTRSDCASPRAIGKGATPTPRPWPSRPSPERYNCVRRAPRLPRSCAATLRFDAWSSWRRSRRARALPGLRWTGDAGGVRGSSCWRRPPGRSLRALDSTHSTYTRTAPSAARCKLGSKTTAMHSDLPVAITCRSLFE